MFKINNMDLLKTANEVISIEIDGLVQLKNNLNHSFVDAVNMLYRCNGKVVLTGMGKSGLVASKIAATMSSTGTTTVFMHPAEAIHGDLGIICKDDVVIAFSYSGETDEILKLVPSLRRLDVSLISITGNLESTLAKNSDISLNIKVNKEACPLELAPTASTTSTLALGDAIAVCLMKMKNFKEIDFATYHPGGSLGRRLLIRVEDEMLKDNLPMNKPNDTFDKVIFEISKGKLGLTVIVNDNLEIMGLITDGDLRLAMEKNLDTIISKSAKDIMNANPITASKDISIHMAEIYMIERKINSLIIAENNKLIGILNQRNIKKL